MAEKHRFAKLPSNVKALIFTVAILLFLVALMLSFFLFSKHCDTALGWPKVKQGEYDKNQMVNNDPVLVGEWELYYDKWLITDNVGECDFDAYVDLPKRWTGTTLKDGRVLDNTGYGSYRAVIRSIKKGMSFYVFNWNYIGAYRVFINGDLYTEYGVVSKNPDENSSTGLPQVKNAYVAQNDEDIEIIIEVGASNEGGFHAGIWMQMNATTRPVDVFVQTIGIWVFGFLIALLLVNIGMNIGIGTKDKKAWSLTVFLLSLVLLLASSTDMLPQLIKIFPSTNYNIMMDYFYCSALFVGASFLANLVLSKIINIPKWYIIGAVIVHAACIITFFVLRGNNLRIVPIIIQLGWFSLLFYPLFHSTLNKVEYSPYYIFMLFALLFIFVLMPFDALDVVLFGSESSISISLMVLMSAITGMYWKMFIDKTRRTQRAAELENEVIKVKSEALRAQIKPHFIFNSLTSIQNLYRTSIERGDDAMNKFSKHLRLHISTGEKDLVPFDEEIKNILNYVELEQMRYDDEITFLLDTEFSDFSLPILSLQPFIENAIKYAKTQFKPNGFIQLISKLDGDMIVLQIIDNGIGFDVESVSVESTGIRNCKERLEIALDAEVNIESTPEEGTTVTIRFPLEKAV